MRFVLAVALCLGMAGESWAAALQEITAPVVAPAPPPEFDPFLQPVDNQAASEEARLLESRRSYLKVHQAAGLTALVLTIGQVALGQYLLSQNQAGVLDDRYETLRDVHLGTGIAAFTAYSVAAGAAIASPKVDRTGAWDTITAHKGLALIHGTGMLISPFLGWYMTEKKTEMDFEEVERLQTIHQVTGFTTAAALAGAFLVITLQ
jgi:hypothetical protein